MNYILAVVFVALLAGIALILKKNVGGTFAKALTTSRLTWASILLFLGLAIAITIPKIGSGKEGENSGTAGRPAELRGLLTWHKEPGKEGINKELVYLPIAVRINHLDNSFVEFESINGGPKCIFTATKKIEERTYSGAWSQQTPRDGGNFTLTFEDSSTAKGELWDRLKVKATITLRIF